MSFDFNVLYGEFGTTSGFVSEILDYMKKADTESGRIAVAVEWARLDCDLFVGPLIPRGAAKVWIDGYEGIERVKKNLFLGFINPGDEVAITLHDLIAAFLEARILGQEITGGDSRCSASTHGPSQEQAYRENMRSIDDNYHLAEEFAIATRRRCRSCLQIANNFDFSSLVPDADPPPGWSATTTSPDGSLSIAWGTTRISY